MMLADCSPHPRRQLQLASCSNIFAVSVLALRQICEEVANGTQGQLLQRVLIVAVRSIQALESMVQCPDASAKPETLRRV